MQDAGYKRCVRCGEDKPTSKYYRRRQGTSDGLQKYCRECMLAAAAVHYEENREAIIARVTSG